MQLARWRRIYGLEEEKDETRGTRADRESEGEKANFEVGGTAAHPVREGGFYD